MNGWVHCRVSVQVSKVDIPTKRLAAPVYGNKELCGRINGLATKNNFRVCDFVYNECVDQTPLSPCAE